MNYILLLIITIIILDYLKNVYKVQNTIENIFKYILFLEKTTSNIFDKFIEFYISEIKKFFYAESVYLFQLNNNNITILSDISSKNPDIFPFPINKKTEISIKEIYELSTNKEKANFIKDKLALEKKISHIHFIKKENDILYIIILTYKNRLIYLRSLKSLILHTKKLNNFTVEILESIKNKNEDILSITLNNLKDYAVITLDTNKNIISFNKGAEIIFGYNYNEIINKNIRELIKKEEFYEFDKSIETSISKEENKIKITMLDKNNNEVITETLIKKITYDNKHLGFYLLINDETKEEIWKNTIKEKTNINKSIIENTRDGILLLDEHNNIKHYNEKIKKILDIEDSNILGKNISSIIKHNTKEIENKIKELRKYNSDITLLDIKIKESWYNIRFFSIKNEKNEFSGVVIFFIDNTTLMEAKNKIEKMNKSYIESLKSAKIMQKSLLPATLPDNKDIKITNIFIPSEDIGGDFYYVEKINIDNRDLYCIIISDVAGHGISAAVLTVLVKDAFNEFCKNLITNKSIHPSELINLCNLKVNNLKLSFTIFITMFLLIIDPKNKKIYFSSAGHPHAILLDNNKNINKIGIMHSPPIGIYENYEYKEDFIKLNNEKKLILFTDGILDLFTENDIQFIDYISQNNEIEKVKKDIENLLNKTTIQKIESNIDYKSDDITILFCDLL